MHPPVKRRAAHGGHPVPSSAGNACTRTTWPHGRARGLILAGEAGTGRARRAAPGRRRRRFATAAARLAGRPEPDIDPGVHGGFAVEDRAAVRHALPATGDDERPRVGGARLDRAARLLPQECLVDRTQQAAAAELLMTERTLRAHDRGAAKDSCPRGRGRPACARNRSCAPAAGGRSAAPAGRTAQHQGRRLPHYGLLLRRMDAC
jgi:hypothetical protein